VHTQHLDALVADGMRFKNAYCQNRICTPRRVSCDERPVRTPICFVIWIL